MAVGACGRQVFNDPRGRIGDAQLAGHLAGRIGLLGGLVILRGDLGAGKTTLVKGIAQSLGASPDEVTSPTFTLVHEYQGTRRKLYHLDLYRLEREEELLALGMEEMESDPDALVVVEWGEKFASVVARARGQVEIRPGDAPEERLFLVQML